MNHIQQRHKALIPIFNIIKRQKASTFQSDEVSWSSGEKQRPRSWRHDPKFWYRRPNHLHFPHNLNPKDPEQQYPHKRPDGGIQYHNFVYYPRNPDEVDPPIKPEPVFLVYQIRTTRHRPYWEKDIMTRIGISKKKKFTICKNIPEVNAMLWQVKHLVTIVPLKLPKDLPENPNPLHFFIKEDGEVEYNPTCNLDQSNLDAKNTSPNNEWVNGQTRKIFHNSLNLEF